VSVRSLRVDCRLTSPTRTVRSARLTSSVLSEGRPQAEASRAPREARWVNLAGFAAAVTDFALVPAARAVVPVARAVVAVDVVLAAACGEPEVVVDRDPPERAVVVPCAGETGPPVAVISALYAAGSAPDRSGVEK
jgi:hypothetical protein